ncbi:MAG: putative quinol monooxygenase [bacterium]
MIVVIATIECKKESVNFIKGELCKLVAPTLREPGCITYKFYQDDKEPTFFHSYEIWINQDCINRHLKTKPLVDYFNNTKNDITNFVIREMKQIC